MMAQPTTKEEQKTIDGSKLPKPVPIEQKVCPLVQGNCIGERCTFFLPAKHYCGIQEMIVANIQAVSILEAILRKLDK